MNRTRGWPLWILFAAAPLQAADLTPDDFAFGLPVVAAPGAAAYRLTLPLAVYQSTFRVDLADLRVYNAQGELVPYSLSGEAQPAAHTVDAQLPFFPLPSGAHAAIDGVRVTIEAPGSALNLQTQPSGAGSAPVNQYILDSRSLGPAMVGLRLNWSDTDLEYSGRIRVEASDDLDSWRVVMAGAPVANLRADGQAIIQNRVSLAPTKAKFWRVSWLGTAPSLKLVSMVAESTDGPVQEPRASLEETGVRDPTNPEYYTFDLQAHPPIDRITLLLPELNTLANVEFSSRRSSSEAWRPIGRAGVFRIAAADGDLQNAPLSISVNRDRYWRVKAASLSPSTQTLRLHVEWIPDRLIFLARGRSPFMLAYGSSSAAPAEVDLDQLPAGVDIAPATLGKPEVLGGMPRLAVRHAPFPRRPFALWSLLLLAVAGLAWMAWRLIAESGAPK